MAIYYFDPHTTSNGTGTWASPFSLTTDNTSTFTSGDELRIKGVAKTSLLTGPTYSATIINTITYSATGLGTAAAAYDVWYISEMDIFIVVYDTPTADTIRLNSNDSFAIAPANDWSAGATYTFQKVDTATYPWFGASSFAYITNYTVIDNLTISDCWVDVAGTPTRVTDGSVKTLLHRSNGAGGGAQDDTYFSCGARSLSSTTSQRTSNCGYGWAINLNNTHVLAGRGGGSVFWYGSGINHTVYLNQLGGGGYVGGLSPSGWGGLDIGMCLDSTINVATWQGQLFFSYYVLNGCTFNIGLLSANNGGFVTASNYQGVASNVTFNITNVSVDDFYYTGLNPALPQKVGFSGSTFNITGTVDIYTPMYSEAALIADGVPNNTYDFSSATFYNNRRTTTNAIPGGGLFTIPVSGGSGNIGFTTIQPPWDKVTLSAAYSSVTEGVVYGQSTTNAQGPIPYGSLYEPYVLTFIVPSTDPSNLFNTGDNFPTTYKYRSIVLRFLFLDGSDPIEYILIQNKNAGYSLAEDSRYGMRCTKDAAVYRTSGPSLKMYTQILYSGWTGISPTVYPSSDLTYFNGFTKTIKLPVSAASTTVAGYIRSDNATTATGDCRVMILDNNYEVVTYQDMTNASYNSWESFSLNFTPTYAAEYHLAIRNIYPASGKSFWLDDLTIS